MGELSSGPDHGHAVRSEPAIVRDKRCAFNERLCGEQTVERIRMMRREIRQPFRVAERDGQFGEQTRPLPLPGCRRTDSRIGTSLARGVGQVGQVGFSRWHGSSLSPAIW